MASHFRYLLGTASALLTFWFATNAALACACCSNRAARHVEVEKLGESRLGVIERMTFAREAFVAEGADDHPPAIQQLGTSLQLVVTRTATKMAFSFRGLRDLTTDLKLAIPDTIAIFEVDPRGDSKDDGLGPVLYKEWQLTANVEATGVLRSMVANGQKVTLILHGRGRGCTDAPDFTDWTLLVPGPSRKLTLYGALSSRSR